VDKFKSFSHVAENINLELTNVRTGELQLSHGTELSFVSVNFVLFQVFMT